MLNYQEYEKSVFEWLLKKHESDPTFNFSIRQNAVKGAENDYFIGTEKSKYFATTFWIVPVQFPGSSADLINVIFRWDERGYEYRFEVQQTKHPKDLQNELALQLVRQMKPQIKQAIGLNSESAESAQMEQFKTKPRKKNYATIDEMMQDVYADYSILSPIIEQETAAVKHANRAFEGWKIQPKEFEQFMLKLEKRLLKHAPKDAETISQAPLPKENHNSQMDNKIIGFPLNQILYGPPGTGKTYHTINKAIAIIEPGFHLKQDRQKVKEKFEELCQAGRIVFTTFHQSMTYEDFMEGIKPLKPEDTDTFVRYEVRPGIFKTICEKAKSKSVVSNNFENAYNSLLREIKENEGSLVLETLVHAKEFTIYENSKGNLRFHANTEKAYEGVIRKEIIQEFLISGNALDWPSYTKAVAKHLKTKHTYSQTEKEDTKPYVLIIDEINRGNVSQIFGELITLLEPDKRMGNEEALEVKLPYSKDPFSIPSNLYVIGTMNTADRSVEALDTALRRRFSFEEMPPDIDLPELQREVGDIWLPELLKTINRRIEKLLDKDHLIGHSYFLHVSSMDDLKNTFYHNIIPLLQEYFFGDFGKIGLVLGTGFVKIEEKDAEFATFDGYDASELNERPIFRVKKESELEAGEFEAALDTLLNKPK